MRHRNLLVGSRTPWSAVYLIAMVAIVFTLTACGSTEDAFPSSPDVVDELTGDTTPTLDGADQYTPLSYREICAECLRRERGCPYTPQFLAWNGQSSIDTAADELCLPPDTIDPCTNFYDVGDYVWSCDGYDVGEAGGTFEVRPVREDLCEVWWSWEHFPSWSPDDLAKDGYIDSYRGPWNQWIYHGPRSMSRNFPSNAPSQSCTGVRKE